MGLILSCRIWLRMPVRNIFIFIHTLLAYNEIMIKKYPYWNYVVGVFVVWAVVLLIAWQFISTSRFHKVLIFSCGWLVGLLFASLARKFFK